MIKKLRLGLFLLISLALVAFIFAGVYSENFPHGSVSGQASTQKIIPKSPSSDLHPDTGFIGPVINIPKEKEEVDPPESIEVTPSFDSIRPFPGSLLPHHIDSMWFFVSDTYHRETLDSIKLIVKGKELALLPLEKDYDYFNYLSKRVNNNVSFQDLSLNGFKDIKISHWASGATGNNQFSIFLFYEDDTTYLYNTEFSRMTNINVDDEGYYYSFGTGGGVIMGGSTMKLEKVDGEYRFFVVSGFDQQRLDYQQFGVYQERKMYLDTKELVYRDTFMSDLVPYDGSQFHYPTQMGNRVKYYNPEIHCTPITEDDPLPDCTFTFQSRLKDHEIQIFSDLKNMRLEISDEGSFDSVVLDIEINKNDKDFKLTSSYLRAALSFYENWRSEPGLYLFIRSANIELIDPRNDNKYNFEKPLQLL